MQRLYYVPKVTCKENQGIGIFGVVTPPPTRMVEVHTLGLSCGISNG